MDFVAEFVEKVKKLAAKAKEDVVVFALANKVPAIAFVVGVVIGKLL